MCLCVSLRGFVCLCVSLRVFVCLCVSLQYLVGSLYGGNHFVAHRSHTFECVFLPSIVFVLDFNLSISVFL